jgi:hypothetical protein
MTMDFFTRFALFHKSKVTISQMPAHQNLINPQRLYIKKGYLPDGKGISQNGKRLLRGENIIINDDLVLYLTKKVK